MVIQKTFSRGKILPAPRHSKYYAGSGRPCLVGQMK